MGHDIQGWAIFEAIEPVCHGTDRRSVELTSVKGYLGADRRDGGKRLENVVYAARRKVVRDDGTVDALPIAASGVALRSGIIRRAIARHVLRRYGFGPETAKACETGYDWLFTGGPMAKKDWRFVPEAAEALRKAGLDELLVKNRDVFDETTHGDLSSRLRQLFPWLSLLGGSIGWMLMPGKISVSDAFPVTARFNRLWRGAPIDGLPVVNPEHGEDLIGRAFMVRRPEALFRVEGEKENSDEREGKDENGETSKGDVCSFEYVAAGTAFCSRISSLEPLTDEETGALIVGLREMAGEGRRLARLGGKGGLGFGGCAARVAVSIGDAAVELTSADRLEVTDWERAFDAHLDANREFIAEVIRTMKYRRETNSNNNNNKKNKAAKGEDGGDE